MMTYLSQYTVAKLKPNKTIPKSPVSAATRQTPPSESQQYVAPVAAVAAKTPSAAQTSPVAHTPSSSALTARAFGPGVQAQGVKVNKPTSFTIQLDGGDRSRSPQVDVTVRHSQGDGVPCEAVYDAQARTFTVTYTTPYEGQHEVCRSNLLLYTLLYSDSHSA
jgi:hypothetical protein